MSTSYQLVTDELKYFLAEVQPNDLPYSHEDKQAAYTASGKYLIYTTYYHHSLGMPELMERIYELPGQTVMDVGCCTGVAGLMVALDKGRSVTFHDFEGLGLTFIRWFIEKHGLKSCRIIPYGQSVEVHDLAIALDVIEHTGNHLGFIRWVNGLGRSKVICYPLMPYAPPYVNILDEWVDDEAIRQIVSSRYGILFDWKENGRRFLAWR